MDRDAAYREANLGLVPAHREGLYAPQSHLWLKAVHWTAEVRLGAHCLGVIATARSTALVEHGFVMVGPPGHQIGWLKKVRNLAWQIGQDAVVLKAAGETATLLDGDGGQTELGAVDAERVLDFYELLRPVRNAHYYSFSPGRSNPIMTTEQAEFVMFDWIGNKT